MDVLKIISLLSGIVGGFIAVSYKQIAEQRGWTIGRLFFKKSSSWLVIIIFLIFLNSCEMSFQSFKWWQATLLIVISWLFAYVATFCFKSIAQYVSILLAIVSVVLYIISFGE